eukprot:1189732-Prorocentrum_minimum.AAC.6
MNPLKACLLLFPTLDAQERRSLNPALAKVHLKSFGFGASQDRRHGSARLDRCPGVETMIRRSPRKFGWRAELSSGKSLLG